ncbi:MAG: hypothetical protein IJ049_04325 [Oscillospiraceae bacterium]|nr:hypothetical protein [Oscillospiraceae bacterium]
MNSVKANIWRGIYLLLGITLIGLVIVTGAYGLDQADRDIYEMAMELDDAADGFGFRGFSVKEHTVRISNGRVDYVMWDGAWEKEPAAFDTLVATAQEIDGAYQVILPSYRAFSDFLQSMETFATLSEGGGSFSSETYSPEAHAATLWHEAFHAWQFSRFEDDMTGFMEGTALGDTSPESVIASKVDPDKGYMQSLENEVNYLYRAYSAENREDVLSWLRLALDEETQRRDRLDEEAVAAERYLEMVEGTARYVESLAYRELTDTDAWRAAYLTEGELSGGADKYYTIGMLKCLLLDTLAPGWQDGFALPADLSEALEDAMQTK